MGRYFLEVEKGPWERGWGRFRNRAGTFFTYEYSNMIKSEQNPRALALSSDIPTLLLNQLNHATRTKLTLSICNTQPHHKESFRCYGLGKITRKLKA